MPCGFRGIEQDSSDDSGSDLEFDESGNGFIKLINIYLYSDNLNYYLISFIHT